MFPLFLFTASLVTKALGDPGLFPPWNATWNMSLSTVFMPCDASGHGLVPFPPSVGAQWGVSDWDWSNGKAGWSQQTPMNCEESLLAQAEATNALNPAGKNFIYRNAIKALPFFSSVREKLEDRSYWGWFLPYKNCTAFDCGINATQNLYHDFLQTPRGDCGSGIECGEYLFDLRNESLREWLRTDYILGPTGLGSPAVHGFYFDDGWNQEGPTEEDPRAVAACGLSKDDVQALIDAYKLSYQEKINATIAHGGFVFDKFDSPSPPNITSAPQQCLPFLRRYCGANSPSQTGPMLLQFSRVNHTHPWPLPYPNQDLATFLLVRGDYGWLGYGWAGCYSPETYTRPAGLDADYGTPLGFCSEESSSGVFTRNYTKASVSLDCNTFTARIVQK
jgi:hypothetical protein